VGVDGVFYQMLNDGESLSKPAFVILISADPEPCHDITVKPALFTRVRDEIAETSCETGARSREGGKHT
jgi:hypothetical protein